MEQVARNITDGINGFLKGYKYLIHDRDPHFTANFLTILKDAGVESVRLPKRSPDLKGYASYCTSLVVSGMNRFFRDINGCFCPCNLY